MHVEELSTMPRKEEGTSVQYIQRRSNIEHDHFITNFIIEYFKALQSGQSPYLEHAYFLPEAALELLKIAMIDDAKRGAKINILTNSLESTDLKPVSKCSVFTLHKLLQEENVRIFERKCTTTLHSRTAVFAANTSSVGSWLVNIKKKTSRTIKSYLKQFKIGF